MEPACELGDSVSITSYLAWTHFDAIEFLTLDVTRDIYDDIGFIVAQKEFVCESLRSVASFPRPYRNHTDALLLFKQRIGTDCAQLVPMIGLHAARVLSHWLVDIFELEENNWALLYDLFSAVASRWRRTGVDVLNLSDPERFYGSSYKSRMCSNDTKALDARYMHPATEWDRVMAKRFTDEGFTTWSPYGVSASTCIAMNRFQLHWMSILPAFRQYDLLGLNLAVENRAGKKIHVENMHRRLPLPAGW